MLFPMQVILTSYVYRTGLDSSATGLSKTAIHLELLAFLAVEMIMAVSLTMEVRKSRKQAWGWGAGPESRSFRGKLYFETKPRVYFDTRPAAMQRETSFNLKTNKN